VDAKVLQTYTKVEIIIFPKPPQTHPVTIGNESVPIQLAQCRFSGLASSNANI